MRRFSMIVLAAGAAVAAGAASAQSEMSAFAQRCQVPELQLQDGSDPCSLPMAAMGLSGPVVMSRAGTVDVETTGSVKAAGPDRAQRGEKAR